MQPQDLPQPPSVDARFRELIASGEREAAARLLFEVHAAALTRKLTGRALPLGGGDEAEHLANQAITLAVTKGAAFDPERGTLAAWVFWLGRNLALSQQRKLRPDPGLKRDFAAHARTVESRIQNRDAFLRVWKRISSDVLRQVLFLDLKHGGQAPGALARELGLDRATFYKRRSEARRLFRELWQEEFGDPSDSFYGELS